ncbi:troponin T-like isoform X3 [Biomphalaria glabrata]|uniref:Troponin T-like isoform X3 n=1 Tax=Biomphalaria glabrata TaxID=6526 RepID=A0A9W3BJM5_BIOGL|nr:troponin T-like isoform X3 [Biomphalaria glabrata]
MSEEEQTVEAGGEEEKTVAAEDAGQSPVDANEAKRAMEEAKKARQEKQAAELAEYEEMRKSEKVKEEEEIRSLREKRIQRQKERVEEEKRLTELRAQEDARRKAEEEERRRKKQEEENKVKDERERKKREAEERLKPKGRNFKISKKSDSEKGGPELDTIMTKEELQKSKEQLEEEKRAILAQRIQPLVIDGLASDKLIEKAKELNDHIKRLEGDKYDLEQRFKRQQYDMIELAERARQMNKGKAKRGVTTVQVDESFDRLADKFTSAPPKIQLCSKYERHTDHRSYKERMVLFEDLAKEPPPPELIRVSKTVSQSPGAETAE